MSSELTALLGTAIGISLLHTLAGPDHYLPFIALAKARGWTVRRTLFWTAVCGCGHVWSSVLLGLVAASIGWSLSKTDWVEGIRGDVAGISLLVFGAVYFVWGLLRARKAQRHKHFDVYDDGSVYVFEHKHGEAVAPKERHAVTPWVMFLIFLLGPCEPMIPLLYVPAVHQSLYGMMLLIAVYTFFTLLMMMTMVLLGYYGFSFLASQKLERYMHTLGGAAIALCGAGIVFMEW